MRSETKRGARSFVTRSILRRYLRWGGVRSNRKRRIHRTNVFNRVSFIEEPCATTVTQSRSIETLMAI